MWEKRVAELSGFYPKFLDYARLDFFSRMAFGFFNLGKVGSIHSFLKSNYFKESKLGYDQSHYFDLGPIPKPNPKLKQQLSANNKTPHNLLLKVKPKRV